MTDAGVGIYIAGMYLDPLLENLDELEEQFKGLDLYAELADRLDESFDMLFVARAFCVDKEAGTESDASAVILAVWQNLDSVLQEVEFSDLNTLAFTVRMCARPSESAPDSVLLSALVMCYVVEGLREIYAYLIELSQSLVSSVPQELIEEFPDLRQSQLRRAREKLMLSEIHSRVIHAEYIGQARLAMFAAGMYREAEKMMESSKGYRISEKIRSAIHLSRASAGGITGAKRHREQAGTDAEMLCKKAAGKLRANPDMTPSELVKILCETEGLSAPTVRKYLRSQDFYPPNKKS